MAENHVLASCRQTKLFPDMHQEHNVFTLAVAAETTADTPFSYLI